MTNHTYIHGAETSMASVRERFGGVDTPAAIVGMLTALGAFLFAVFIIYKMIVYGDPVQGYPSLMVVMLFLGGVQLIGIGMIGEYLGRMFNETKQRPLYLLNRIVPSRLGQKKDGTASQSQHSAAQEDRELDNHGNKKR